MSAHNIQFHYKIRKTSLNICFLELLEEFTVYKMAELSPLNGIGISPAGTHR